MVALVFCSLPSYAPVNANTQGELHLGQLWQYDASLLHLARTEDCGIGRVESDEYAIVKAQENTEYKVSIAQEDMELLMKKIVKWCAAAVFVGALDRKSVV